MRFDPQTLSPTLRALNPHLLGGADVTKTTEPKPITRIRQSEKPLLNKLEQEWFDILSVQFPNYPRPRAQAKKYKIGNNAWYKPDITISQWPRENGPACETAFECKGPSQMKGVDRGILTIKVAAHQWPDVRFVLVWKDSGRWHQQEVLP